MATGDPINKRLTKGCINSTDFKLEYEGKKDKRDILNQKPGNSGVKFEIGTKPSNKIYYGENKKVLLELLSDESVKGKVKLVYIDPPFATNSKFKSRNQEEAYSDHLVGANFLEFMRERLVLLRELMEANGVIFVHLDEKMAFPIKILMDEIFGKANYINWITRVKSNRKNSVSRRLGNISDYIMVYSKGPKYTWNKVYDPWTEEDIKKQYPCIDKETGKRFKKVPIHAPGIRNGDTGKPWKGMLPPKGKHWQYTRDKLDNFDKTGQIYWSPNGNPRRIVYFEDNQKGIAAQDIWTDFKDAHNQNIKITGYPTEKNLNLIERIIKSCTNEGDLVLDCFMGSGTTLVASEKNKRAWIGVDEGFLAVQTTLDRLKNDSKPMGDFVGKKISKFKKEELKNLTFSFNVEKEKEKENIEQLNKIWQEN